MNPQVNAIMLAVKDIERAKEFYSQDLGCQIRQDVRPTRRSNATIRSAA